MCRSAVRLAAGAPHWEVRTEAHFGTGLEDLGEVVGDGGPFAGGEKHVSWVRREQVGFGQGRTLPTPGDQSPEAWMSLNPWQKRCQLGGGWAAGRCFDLCAAVFCSSSSHSADWLPSSRTQLLATNSRFLTSLGNSAQRECAARWGHCADLPTRPRGLEPRTFLGRQQPAKTRKTGMYRLGS